MTTRGLVLLAPIGAVLLMPGPARAATGCAAGPKRTLTYAVHGKRRTFRTIYKAGEEPKVVKRETIRDRFDVATLKVTVRSCKRRHKDEWRTLDAYPSAIQRDLTYRTDGEEVTDIQPATDLKWAMEAHPSQIGDGTMIAQAATCVPKPKELRDYALAAADKLLELPLTPYSFAYKRLGKAVLKRVAQKVIRDANSSDAKYYCADGGTVPLRWGFDGSGQAVNLTTDTLYSSTRRTYRGCTLPVGYDSCQDTVETTWDYYFAGYE